MKNIGEIKSIATQTRKKCENFAMSDAAIMYDFYNFRNLSCMCAIASFVLAKELNKHNIKAKMVEGTFEGEAHCWVEWKNWIIDITATQFDIEAPVYIVKKTDEKYKAKKVKQSYKDFRIWPREQKPSKTVCKMIMA